MQREDPRLQVQTATHTINSVEESDRPIRSNWILNKDIAEVIRIYFPDLTDDEDTKTMVKGLFEAEENDKSMVVIIYIINYNMQNIGYKLINGNGI